MNLGESNYKEALNYLEFAMDSNGASAMSGSIMKESYNKFLVYFYKQKDVENFTKVLRRLLQIGSIDKPLYEKTLNEMINSGKIPNLNI